MTKIIERNYNGMVLHEHYCPGCQYMHQIAVKQPFRNGARWTFNGDLKKPTFSPSIKVAGTMPDNCCHYFIKEGKLQYCNDSHHEFKGKTIDLPEIPKELL